jgi:hypothetical protein
MFHFPSVRGTLYHEYHGHLWRLLVTHGECPLSKRLTNEEVWIRGGRN